MCVSVTDKDARLSVALLIFFFFLWIHGLTDG